MTRPNLCPCSWCEDDVEPNDDGTCPFCDRVIDDMAAQDAEQAMIEEFVGWERNVIEVDMTR